MTDCFANFPLTKNLYVHFPFCRRKCTYCALHSRVGVSAAERADYVARLVRALESFSRAERAQLETVYFGGGSPALCSLAPLLDALQKESSNIREFTVELHPNDVTRELLQTLKAGGVNRISMGVQATDDATLRHMRRAYTFREAQESFAKIKEFFANAGVDLIVGYPKVDGANTAFAKNFRDFANWDLTHISVYSLIHEANALLAKTYHDPLPSDEETLNALDEISRFLSSLGFSRYEISNFAKDGFECQHNFAIWRGEDYYGLGEGAHGRIANFRTQNAWGKFSLRENFRDENARQKNSRFSPQAETVSREQDHVERTIFRLRTRDGISAAQDPQWIETLDAFVREGLLTREEKNPVYHLTSRGTEVCDSILAELL